MMRRYKVLPLSASVAFPKRKLTFRLKVLHELEEELNVQILPGTEIMADVGSHHFVKSNSGVLVPQPTDDPRDPLVCAADVKHSEERAEMKCRIGIPFGSSRP